MKRWPVALGAFLALPSFLFVTSEVLNHELGMPFVYNALRGVMQYLNSPVTILGGLLTALALNLWPVLRLSIKRDAEVVTRTVALRLSAANLAVVALAGTLLAVILVYLVLENFGQLMRGQG